MNNVEIEAEQLVTDPVCGMVVAPSTAAMRVEYEGEEWSFCSVGCGSAFERDPQRFMPAPATRRECCGSSSH